MKLSTGQQHTRDPWCPPYGQLPVEAERRGSSRGVVTVVSIKSTGVLSWDMNDAFGVVRTTRDGEPPIGIRVNESGAYGSTGTGVGTDRGDDAREVGTRTRPTEVLARGVLSRGRRSLARHGSQYHGPRSRERSTLRKSNLPRSSPCEIDRGRRMTVDHDSTPRSSGPEVIPWNI